MSCNTSVEKSNEEVETKNNEKPKATNSLNVSQNKMVRTDCSEQKIDKFLNTSDSSMLLSKSKTDSVIVR